MRWTTIIKRAGILVSPSVLLHLFLGTSQNPDRLNALKRGQYRFTANEALMYLLRKSGKGETIITLHSCLFGNFRWSSSHERKSFTLWGLQGTAQNLHLELCDSTLAYASKLANQTKCRNDGVSQLRQSCWNVHVGVHLRHLFWQLLVLNLLENPMRWMKWRTTGGREGCHRRWRHVFFFWREPMRLQWQTQQPNNLKI